MPSAFTESSCSVALTDLIHKYPEAIEEIGASAQPLHPTSLAAHMISQDVLQTLQENSGVENVHRAAGRLAADVDAVGAGVQKLVKEMHKQLDRE